MKLNDYLYSYLEGVTVTTYRDGTPSGLMPESHLRIVNYMVDAIIDLAGKGDLLKSIDRMHRETH
jgi:hypothetical protein